MTATLREVAAELEARVPGRVTRGESVSELTTYRLGGPLAVAVHVNDERVLSSVAEVVTTARPAVLVIGRGSNLLVADAGFAGVGIVLSGAFDEIVVDRDASSVSAGAAVPLPVLARRAAAAGIGGLEFLVGIPGSVGGAVRMNAGGHGAETRDVLSRAWVCPLVGADAGRITERDAIALELGYRRSSVGPHDVVTRADLHGAASDPDACAARIEDIVRWRREHQPGGANAGSVFRNPPGDSAGRLIDAAGCKGLRVGGAVVSEKHANFFQADLGATADDVFELLGQVRRRVLDHAGVCLVPELQMIGFDDPSGGEAGAGEADS